MHRKHFRNMPFGGMNEITSICVELFYYERNSEEKQEEEKSLCSRYGFRFFEISTFLKEEKDPRS